jgi:hypothetical protein
MLRDGAWVPLVLLAGLVSVGVSLALSRRRGRRRPGEH